jgi:hypothetical protein
MIELWEEIGSEDVTDALLKDFACFDFCAHTVAKNSNIQIRRIFFEAAITTQTNGFSFCQPSQPPRFLFDGGWLYPSSQSSNDLFDAGWLRLARRARLEKAKIERADWVIEVNALSD